MVSMAGFCRVDLLDLAAIDGDGTLDDGIGVLKRPVLDLASQGAPVAAGVHFSLLENRLAEHGALGGKRGPGLGVKTIKVKAGPGLIIEINLGESTHTD